MSRSSKNKHVVDEQSANLWRVVRRRIVSVMLLFHIAAVVIAPLASPPPSSDLARACARRIQPYLQAVAINNGYRFFAPDPGPSHVVRYEIELDEGARIDGRIPNIDRHWPRLLYHRHFMVAETMFNLAMPVAEIPAGGFVNDLQRAEFDRQREQAQRLLHGVSQELLRSHAGARRVRLFALEHEIPTPWELADGLKLDDPRLYVERPLYTLDAEDS